MKKIAVYIFDPIHIISGGTEEMVINLLAVLNPQELDITLITTYPHIHPKYQQQINPLIKIKSILNNQHGKFVSDKNNSPSKWRWHTIFRIKKNIFKHNILQKIYNQHFQQSVFEYDYIIDSSSYIVVKSLQLLTPITPTAKIICWFHFDINELNKLIKYTLTPSLDMFLPTLDKLILVNQTTKNDMITQLKNKNLASKIMTIYNGINFNRIYELSNASIATLNTIEQNIIQKPYLLMVARLSSQKDHATLIKAFHSLVDKYPEYYLVFAGGLFNTTNQIQQLVKSLGIEHKVLLLGAVANPFIWIKYCKISIISTYYEGFGLVILESMLLHKPVIVSNIATCLEAINYGQCGFPFKSGDVLDLVNTITYILEEQYNKEKLLENCDAFIQQFSLNNFASAFNSLIT